MSKRRLSKQQKQRIQERQEQTLTAEEPGMGAESELAPRAGTVICHYGQEIDVEPIAIHNDYC